MTTRADLEAATWVGGIALVPRPTKEALMDDKGYGFVNKIEKPWERIRRLTTENERLRGLLYEVIDGTVRDEYSVTWEWLERAKAEVGE